MVKTIDLNIFKVYDIRGKYPEEINENAVSEIASYLPRIIKNSTSDKKNNNKQLAINNHQLIIIAHDARLSSPTLYRAIIKQLAISNQQLAIIKIGLSTTPMFYFLVNHFNADGGIMITASHNPKEYNGLKIVGKNAMPISGEEIGKLVN